MGTTNADQKWRFSLRGMFLMVAVTSVVMWGAIQLNWIHQRRAWRVGGPTAIRAVQDREPPGLLRFLGERGEANIMVVNGTEEQLAEVRRLFPEAIVTAGPAPPASSGPTDPANLNGVPFPVHRITVPEMSESLPVIKLEFPVAPANTPYEHYQTPSIEENIRVAGRARY
jgi:hypothetical protein